MTKPDSYQKFVLEWKWCDGTKGGVLSYQFSEFEKELIEYVLTNVEFLATSGALGDIEFVAITNNLDEAKEIRGDKVIATAISVQKIRDN